MADATPSRLGVVNVTGGDPLALFLKVFAGEVLTSFRRSSVMLDLHTIRTISSGKSASFPRVGKIGAHYHVPGAELTGQQVPHTEKVINIDGLLVSDVFIADIDEAMNHYDVRGPYSAEMGAKLAYEMDRNVLINVILAARAPADLSGNGESYFGGSVIANDKFKIDATVGAADTEEQARALAQGIFSAAQILDEKDVPEEDRYAIFRPAEYYTLFNHTDLINRDFGGRGSIAEGSILKIAGITIRKSNNLPKVDNTSTQDKHKVNATKTVGVVFHRSAVGTVKLLDLNMQSAYDIRRQGTLLVARYAMGHGVLRPESAVELALDTLTN